MSIVLDGTAGIIVSGNTNTLAGVTVGLGAGSISSNTAIGLNALNANTTGAENAAFGTSALIANTTGGYNTAIGTVALQANTTGSQNTAIGNRALYLNTTAERNTAVGYTAGFSNTTGHITAVGYEVLYANTTGSGNTGIGGNDTNVGACLKSNTTGSNNIAVGTGALLSNTTASNNTAVGYQAGYTNQTGTANAFFGLQAGYTATGNRNTFIGPYVGYSVTTGAGNTFIGNGGSNNSAGSGYDMTSGDNNIIVGGFTGNQDSLDIRTSSAYVVISDGLGRRQISMAEGQTLALDSAVPNSGTGITFPATQSASSNANTLDDYEEGTWTPDLTADSGSPTYSGTSGKYTKIGNMVYVGFAMEITSKGALTGSINVSGLPFTVESGYSSSAEVWGMTYSFVGGLSTSVVSMYGWANNGSTLIQLRKQTAAATSLGSAYLQASDISDTFYIQASCTYRVS